MPVMLRYHSAVEIGGDIYTIGGYASFVTWTTAIYRLSCSSRVCTWTTMTQKLKVARDRAVAIPVQKSLCVSTTTTTTSKTFYNLSQNLISHYGNLKINILKSPLTNEICIFSETTTPTTTTTTPLQTCGDDSCSCSCGCFICDESTTTTTTTTTTPTTTAG